MGIHSVGSGRDYTTYAAAITALGAGGGSETLRGYGGSDLGIFTVGSGLTTDFTIEAAAAEQHDGTAFDSAKAYVDVGSGQVGAVIQRGCIIRGLQFRATHASATNAISTTGTGVTVDKCYITAMGSFNFGTGISQTLGTTVISRNGVAGRVNAGIFISGDVSNPSTKWLNNSVMLASGMFAGFYCTGGGGTGCTLTKVVNNVAFAPSGTADCYRSGVGVTTTLASNNADFDNTFASNIGSTSNQTGLVSADQFVDTATGNLRLKLGNDLEGNGVSVSADGITEDAFGSAHPSPPAIGWAESAAPEIDVRGPTGVSIADGDSTPSEVDGTSVGEIGAGSPLAIVFSIHNTGTASLSVSTPTLSGTNAADFSITENPATTVAAGASTTFELTFTPSALGLRSAVVSIVNNDSDENPYAFSVEGTGRIGGFDMSNSERVSMAVSAESTYATAPTGGGSVYTYLPFSGESMDMTTQTRRSSLITGDRQHASVRPMSKESGGAINFELVYGAYDILFGALMYSAWDTAVVVAAADTAVAVSASGKTFTHSTGWDNNPTVGQWIKTSGFDEAGNNGIFKITAVTATVITVENGADLVDEAAGESVTISRGSEVKNGVTDVPVTIERRFTDLTNVYHQFVGNTIDQFNMRIAAGEFITGSFTLIGQQQITASAALGETYTAAPANEPMSSAQDVIAILRNGTTMEITNGTLQIQNQGRRRPRVGSLFTTSIGSGKVICQGTLQAYFEDGSLVAAHVDYSDNGIALVVQDPDGNQMVFDMPTARFNSSPTNAESESTDVFVNVNYEVVKDATEGITVRVVRFPAA